jgi:hypothetical protein
MTDPETNVGALIARLEAATGPDRELDAEIAASLRIYTGTATWVDGWKGEWRAINGLVHLLGDYGSHGNFRPSAFTASIDAALTLVPEGAEKELSDLYGVAVAKVGLNFHDGPEVGEHKGGSLAIALCIAALRARSALAPEGKP